MKPNLDKIEERKKLLNKIIENILSTEINTEPNRPHYKSPTERSDYNYGYFETKDQGNTIGPDHENNI